MNALFARTKRPGLSTEEQSELASLAEASRRADQQASWLPALEQSYHKHAIAFGYAPESLRAAALEGLAETKSSSGALKLAQKAISEKQGDWHWKRELALVLEQQNHLETALLVRDSIHQQAPSAENSFAMGRLRERLGAGPEIADYYARLFDQSSSNFLLALARRKALASPDASERDRLDRATHQIRTAVAAAPDDIALQLALGFVEMSEGRNDGARRNFLSASILADRKASLIAQLPATVRAPGADYDPWSLNYAREYMLEPESGDGHRKAFHAIDPLHLAVLAARTLRAEGDILGALSQYEAALHRLRPSRSAFSVIRYSGFTILHYRDRFIAVPPRYGWVFSRSFSQQLRMMAPRTSRRFALARKALEFAKRTKRVLLRLPPVQFMLHLALRPARVIARMVAPRLGVIAESELSLLKARIDQLETTGGGATKPNSK